MQISELLHLNKNSIFLVHVVSMRMSKRSQLWLDVKKNLLVKSGDAEVFTISISLFSISLFSISISLF